MKPISLKYSRRGFTFWDLLIVLVTLALVAFILPIFLSRPRVSRNRLGCTSNLKQVGLAFRIWSGDHGEKFPMAVSTNKEGSLEFIGTGNVLQHYLAISNELNTPKVLTCPWDKKRTPTGDFARLSNKNLSYFVGLDADETRPQTILSGDRNLSTNGRIMSGILVLPSNIPVRWTKDIHVNCGNIGLGDGSVYQVTDRALNRQITSNPNGPARLEIP